MKYLYFTAPWCKPCVLLSPIMLIVSEEVEVKKVIVDEDIDIAKKYKVRNIPTVILIDENELEIKRFKGINNVKFYLEQYNKYVK